MFEPFEGILPDYGYIGLFLASFLAATILPFGSEGIVVLLVLQGFNVPAVILVASAGNFLGACTGYYIGMKGRSLVEKYLSIEPSRLDKAELYFSRYGSYVLLFTWLPLIGDALTVMGGVLRLRFLTFSVFVFTGKFLRYLTVAYLAAL